MQQNVSYADLPIERSVGFKNILDIFLKKKEPNKRNRLYLL